MPTFGEAIAGFVATTSGVIFPVDTTTQGTDTLSYPVSKLAYGTTGIANLVSSSLPFPVASASSGLVQISGTPTIVSASSGLVQISGTPTVTSTAATSPWSSAPGFNLPMVSASSGLVQLSGTATIVSASSGLVQISGAPSVVISSSAGLATVTVVAASSGVIQLAPLSTAGTVSGLNVFHQFSTGGAGTFNIKGTPGVLYGWNMANSTAGPLAFHFYNTSSSPTVGSTSSLLMGGLVPGTTGGGGSNMPIGAYGVYASAGIGITLTANMHDTDTGVAGSNSLQVNVYYV